MPDAAPLNIFYKYNANDPTDDKATWVLGHLYEMIEQRALAGAAERTYAGIEEHFSARHFPTRKSGRL